MAVKLIFACIRMGSTSASDKRKPSEMAKRWLKQIFSVENLDELI